MSEPINVKHDADGSRLDHYPAWRAVAAQRARITGAKATTEAQLDTLRANLAAEAARRATEDAVALFLDGNEQALDYSPRVPEDKAEELRRLSAKSDALSTAMVRFAPEVDAVRVACAAAILEKRSKALNARAAKMAELYAEVCVLAEEHREEAVALSYEGIDSTPLGAAIPPVGQIGDWNSPGREWFRSLEAAGYKVPAAYSKRLAALLAASARPDIAALDAEQRLARARIAADRAKEAAKLARAGVGA